jgi:hypothetical protein
MRERDETETGLLDIHKPHKEVSMDFIERFFGISPDGGDGSTELIYFGVIAVIAAIILSRWIAGRVSAKI